jgi:hypothetical protein
MNNETKQTNRAALERRSRGRLQSVAPTLNETIERWGSIIHWLEITVVYVVYPSFTSRGLFRWVVPVTCGACQKRRDAKVYDMNPTGRLTRDCLRSPQYDYTRFGYTGLCRSCLKRINKANTPYPDGTQIYHEERTKDGLPVFCGECKTRGFLNCGLSETLHDKRWPCPSCGEVLGKWLHKESGATVYWLKRKKDERNYVEFDCAVCGDQFYCKDELPRRSVWVGMCPDCWQKEHPRAIKTTKPLPGSSKGIEFKKRFGEAKPKRGRKNNLWGRNVTLPCPIPGCGKENDFHFESTRREGFLPLCKSGNGKKGHTLNEVASFLLIQPQNGNGQKNGGTEKKHRGPEKGFNAKITEETIRAAFVALGSYAPQERLAEEIGVDPRSLRDWQQSRGVSYRQLRQQFTKTGGS